MWHAAVTLVFTWMKTLPVKVFKNNQNTHSKVIYQQPIAFTSGDYTREKWGLHLQDSDFNGRAEWHHTRVMPCLSGCGVSSVNQNIRWKHVHSTVIVILIAYERYIRRWMEEQYTHGLWKTHPHITELEEVLTGKDKVNSTFNLDVNNVCRVFQHI